MSTIEECLNDKISVNSNSTNDEDYGKDCLNDTIDSSKTKLVIVLPENIDSAKIYTYINNAMSPYYEDMEVETTLDINKISDEYENEKEDYENFSEYCMKNYFGYINENNKLVTTFNENGFWDTYSVKEKKITMSLELVNFYGNIVMAIDTDKNLVRKKLDFDKFINTIDGKSVSIIEYE